MDDNGPSQEYAGAVLANIQQEAIMKTALILMSAASILLIFSTTVCGLWLRSHGAPADSVAFHAKIALTTSAVGMVLAVTVLVAVLRASSATALLGQ
jgi:hypothetical protein